MLLPDYESVAGFLRAWHETNPSCTAEDMRHAPESWQMTADPKHVERWIKEEFKPTDPYGRPLKQQHG